MVVKNPCSVCLKCVRSTDRSVGCKVCKLRIHIKCNYISPSLYKDWKENDNLLIEYCIRCFKNALPFGSENDEVFQQTNILGLNNESNLHELNCNLTKNDKKAIKQITNMIIANSDPENENDNFCNYYNIDQFIKKKFPNENKFSIYHQNIHSLQYHIEDLKILLQTLKHNFDVIAISETKLQKNSQTTIDINIPNYQIEHTPTEAGKGGTLLYISDNLNYKPRKDLAIYESKRLESTFIEIINTKGKNSIVGCIYKHHNITQNEFMETLSPLLKKITKEKKTCYLTGDFNMNLLSIEKDSTIDKYFELLTNSKFFPLITLPTRMTTHSRTLIDNIFYNQFCNNIISGNLTVGISDHIPQFSIIPSKISNHIKHQPKLSRRYNKFKPDNFNSDLNKINWEMNDLDVNQYTSNFVNIIDQLLDRHIPLQKMSVNKRKQKSKPWINDNILNAIKVKHKLYDQYLNENKTTNKIELLNQFKQLKNDLTKQIRQSKREYYNSYFQKYSHNARKLWQGINEIISTKAKTKFSPTSIETTINDEQVTITDNRQIANTFNQHYTTVADKILKSRKFPGNKHFTQYLHNPIVNSFLIKPTTPKEIEDIILGFDITKSSGPNSIPNKIIKEIRFSISIPIANICNSSFTSGIFPTILKITKVIPIYKKDSKLNVVNYRPISLLSNINKIIEKLMFKRLYSFLENNKSLYELQFGFRKKHSTNHALLSMLQEIRESIDIGKFAIGVFVDFQKAFDTVNHAILLRKLEHYGIRGITNNWFSSYLNKRKQFVTISNTNSDLKYINHGVPQGSVLGPLLFLVYINDLNKAIRHSTTRHFADDTNLLYTIKNKKRNRNIVRNLNTDLRCLNHWLLANKISLNSTKTEIIFFRKKGTEIPSNKIKLNGIKLVHQTEIKYVGLLFDEYLTFEPQIKTLNTKLKRANNLLAISRHYIPKNLLLQLYYGQFYSHLNYGCQLWGQNINQLEKTFILQKKAVRKISFAHFQAHSDPLFKDLNILKVADVIKMNNILFAHTALNNKTPAHFKNYFNIKQNNHRHQTRNAAASKYSFPSGSLDIPKIRIESSKRQIKYACAKDWNDMLKALTLKYPNKNDECWMQNLSFNTLKQLINTYFLDLY